MKKNKALGFDGVTDNWLKTTKRYYLIYDLWNNQTLQSTKKTFRTDIVPLNKSWPNIPKEEEFRPIIIESHLFKFLEMRFLP